MLNLEKLHTLLNCKLCYKLLHEPIFLPCGESVCKNHSSELIKEKCILCANPHHVPECGFPINKLAIRQLDQLQQKTLFINNQRQFSDSKNVIHDLNNGLKAMGSVQITSFRYVQEYSDTVDVAVDVENPAKSFNLDEEVQLSRFDKMSSLLSTAGAARIAFKAEFEKSINPPPPPDVLEAPFSFETLPPVRKCLTTANHQAATLLSCATRMIKNRKKIA